MVLYFGRTYILRSKELFLFGLQHEINSSIKYKLPLAVTAYIKLGALSGQKAVEECPIALITNGNILRHARCD